MAKRTVEAPRSARYYQAAAYHPALLEPDPLPTFFDKKALNLARLFAGEERLAALIAHDDWVVDEDIIYEIVAVARQIAKEGFPTILVSVDEMLDIARIFKTYDPRTSSDIQRDYLNGPEKIYFNHNVETIDFIGRKTGSPESGTAIKILTEILSELHETKNSAWTARVVAALAYFSVVQEGNV